MILRTTFMVGVLSQFLLAADFAPPTLFPDQNTGSLHDLNRQTLDRQIQAALSGKQPKIKNHPSLPLLDATKLEKQSAPANCFQFCLRHSFDPDESG